MLFRSEVATHVRGPLLQQIAELEQENTSLEQQLANRCEVCGAHKSRPCPCCGIDGWHCQMCCTVGSLEKQLAAERERREAAEKELKKSRLETRSAAGAAGMARSRLDQVCDAAIIPLAKAGISTPEGGFEKAAFELKPCIEKLVDQRDQWKQRAEAAERERDTLRDIRSGMIDQVRRLCKDLGISLQHVGKMFPTGEIRKAYGRLSAELATAKSAIHELEESVGQAESRANERGRELTALRARHEGLAAACEPLRPWIESKVARNSEHYPDDMTFRAGSGGEKITYGNMRHWVAALAQAAPADVEQGDDNAGYKEAIAKSRESIVRLSCEVCDQQHDGITPRQLAALVQEGWRDVQDRKSVV